MSSKIEDCCCVGDVHLGISHVVNPGSFPGSESSLMCRHVVASPSLSRVCILDPVCGVHGESASWRCSDTDAPLTFWEK